MSVPLSLIVAVSLLIAVVRVCMLHWLSWCGLYIVPGLRALQGTMVLLSVGFDWPSLRRQNLYIGDHPRNLHAGSFFAAFEFEVSSRNGGTQN